MIGIGLGVHKKRRGSAPVIPVFVSAVIENADPTKVIVTFDVPLNETPSGGFTIVGKTLSESISGAVVTLTATEAFAYGDTLTVVYTKPALNPLQSLTGGKVASFSEAVTNNVESSIPSNAMRNEEDTDYLRNEEDTDYLVEET
jgi:hypothetical protein